MCYVNSLMPQEIAVAMKQEKVTCMVVVPLFLKLIAKSIRTEAAKQSKFKYAIFKALVQFAPTLPLPLRRKLFQQVHTRFGGELKYFVCGGAPLDVGLIRFFEALGIIIYQGYGMAEASPVIATNAIDANKPGSVGRPLPGVEIAIEGCAVQGEILARGPNIMNGYFDNPELSRKIIDADGWLHTGDIGYVDCDGYLFINGRKKNIIVLGRVGCFYRDTGITGCNEGGEVITFMIVSIAWVQW